MKQQRPPTQVIIRDAVVLLRARNIRALSDCYGQYHYDTKTIDYRTNLRGSLLKDTVLHEVLHAILDQPELKPTTEEDYVCALATGLTQVLKQNPDFALWLTTF